MKFKFALFYLFFPLLSFAQEPNPETIAKEIATGIEERVSEIGEGKFVLITYINGVIEIVSTIPTSRDWTDEYKKSLEAKIVLTIKRGGTIFQLLQIKEKEKVLI